MAVIRAMEHIPGVSLKIVAGNGKEVTITKADLRAAFLATTGTRNARRRDAITAIKQRIVDALGEDQISIEELDLDFDDADGNPLGISARGRSS